MKLVKRPDLYKLPTTFLNIRMAIVLVLGQGIVGIGGFMVLEGYTLQEAFYMVTITLSTVGFNEVQPLSVNGQLFVSVLIIFNIGIFAYLLAVFSYYVTRGELFKKWHLALIGKNILELKNHVIICGYGRYGHEVARNLQHQNIPFIVIDKDATVIDEVQHSDDKILYLHEDATKDEVLQEAGIDKAKALITALPEDSENLFIVLTARQLNRKLNIISRITHARSQRKLELAGADHVVMPEQIGGYYMSTLVSKPGATEFFSYLTRELETDIEFGEIEYENISPACQKMSIRDMDIRKKTGANVIAYRPPDGKFVVNPSPDMILKENSSFIVLGNQEQLKTLRTYLDSLK